MKTVLLVCIASLSMQWVLAQDSSKYLMVTIQPVWNKTARQYNYLLQADRDIKGAEAFYALIPVLSASEIEKESDHPAFTYKNPLPNYQSGYNNFPSESAVLNFITTNGWQLHTVIPETRTGSDYSYSTNHSYTHVYSVTKYLFTRTVK